VLGQQTDGYISYVMKYLDMLIRHDIKPVLVFDGRNLPSKAGTEAKRRENRAKNRQMARDYLKEGLRREARECFQRCVDVTPAMARQVIAACQERNVDCLVAPYEADAQLAFLAADGVVDLVISEDSDLALYGCHKILFKLDSSTRGVFYERTKLPLCLGPRANDFDFAKFRRMCITSGCDYLPSLHGVGLGKAFKFWSLTTDRDLERVLPRMPSFLKLSSPVTVEYVQGFLQAEKTFLYQLVYDPRRRRLRPLTEYPKGCAGATEFPYAGQEMEPELSLQMALGNVDLHSLQRVRYYDPDSPRTVHTGRASPYGAATDHASVWSAQFDPRDRGGQPLPPSRSATLSTVSKTAFGDIDTRGQKRKAEEVDITPSQPEVEEIKKVKKNPEVKQRVIVHSRYFFDPNKGQEKKVVEKEGDDLDEDEREVLANVLKRLDSTAMPSLVTAPHPPMEKVSEAPTPPATTEKKKNVEAKGSWLDQLDVPASVNSRLIYNTDDMKTPTLTRLTPPEGIQVTQEARQAFKPVIVDNKKNVEERRARNPFLKRKSSEEKNETPSQVTKKHLACSDDVFFSGRS